ncbi:MAG TPA: hypothetical protein VFE61_33040 [Candidatus Sulfotelmatobacter sp.]|nr:hypothetical protein [Candidatus Sulfotelmatobacter sp.]
MEINAEDPTRCTGGVDSAILSDGHTEGDLRYVTVMHQQWLGFHQGILESLPLLTNITNHETDRADLTKVADVLRRRIASIPNSTPDHQEWGERALYVQLESELRPPPEQKEEKALNDENPEKDEKAESGSKPRPVAEAVPEAKDATLDYREMAVLLIAKLQEWKIALEENLPPK